MAHAQRALDREHHDVDADADGGQIAARDLLRALREGDMALAEDVVRALPSSTLVHVLQEIAVASHADEATARVHGRDEGIVAGALEAVHWLTPREISVSGGAGVITVAETARLLGVDRNTLYEMLKRGEGPPARRCGTTYRLDREAVRAWLREGDGSRSRRSR